MNEQQRDVRKSNFRDYCGKVPSTVLEGLRRTAEQNFRENTEKAQLNADDLNVINAELAARNR